MGNFTINGENTLLQNQELVNSLNRDLPGYDQYHRLERNHSAGKPAGRGFTRFHEC